MVSRTPIAALLAATLLAGCANSAISLRTTNSPSMPSGGLPPGMSSSSSGLQVDVSPATYLSALLFGFFLGRMHDASRGWSEGAVWRKPPELTEDRSVAERDCSQPMERPYANLRCK